MSLPKTRLYVLILALAANLALAAGPRAGEAHACSCASAPLKSEIKRSDAVFSGEVRSIDDNAVPGSAGEVGAATGKVSLAVRDSWKGVTAGTVEVYGQGDGVNCYNIFEKGEAYLVYASRAEGKGDPVRLENNGCGGTKPLAGAEADLRLLGPPTGFLPETGGPGMPPRLAPIIVAIVLLGATARVVTSKRRG